MDWAEEKYDVSFTLFNSLKFLTKLFCQWNNNSSYYVCAVETPHCSNQNGAEGPLLIHPTPDVLDPV